MIDEKQISEMEKAYRTALMNSISGYKPLNLLATINDEGKSNVCIVSSVFHMGSNPPLLGMVMRPQRPQNDSLRNIKSIGQYTLNNVVKGSFLQAHQTSASYPSGVSEFEQCGFTEFYDKGFKPPFVLESTVKIGLEAVKMLDIDLNGTTLVIGKINRIITSDGIILPDGAIDHIIAGTVVGSGLDSYFTTNFLDRLAYAKPGISTASITSPNNGI